MVRNPNDVTLKINGTEYSGWEEIELTLRAEAFPNSFAVKVSKPPSVTIKIAPGDECVVLMGDDRVITGYIDVVTESGDAESHAIAVQGRGRTQDLVDCSAEWPSQQLIGGNAQTIAAKLALPYSIDVVMLNGASPGPDVPQWPLNYGETPAEIIQRLARNAGLLAYENNKGELALAAVGSDVAASGIAYGYNVENWTGEQSLRDRFSEYVCTLQTLDAMMELSGSEFFYGASDVNVKRHRVTYLIAETVAADANVFVKQKAEWEAARRAGRSYVMRATVDSWRDDAGKLWAPNTFIPVALPAMSEGDALVISEVTFRRTDHDGTTADLTCMRKEAFTPEPIVLTPLNAADMATPNQ